MSYTVYHLPGTDARVAIASDGLRASVSFLAKGRSRKADRTYTKRNPERRALFLHVAGFLSGHSLRDAEWVDRAGDVVASRGGPLASPVTRHSHDTPEEVRGALLRAHSGAGNYRIDLALDLHARLDAQTLAHAWGLLPCEGVRAPKEVRWLR